MDGRIAVAWYVYDTGSHELRVTELDGRDSRVRLPTGEAYRSIEPLDWSPSDDQILVALWDSAFVWELGLVDLEGGTIRSLKRLSWLAPGGEQTYPRASFSPDGRFVAYDYRPDMEARTRDIYALDVSGGGETTLVSGPSVNRFLGWLPDGSGILFYSDRGDAHGIWRLPLQDGRPVGKAQLVQPDIRGLHPLGFTERGFVYGVGEEADRVHVAKLDLEGGDLPAEPLPFEDPPEVSSLAADWSPDGAFLAYVTQDPPPGDTETLVIRTREGDVVRRLLLPPSIHTSSSTFRWVAEDQVVLFAMERGRGGIYRMNPADGLFRRFSDWLMEGVVSNKWFEVGPDGRGLYLVLPPRRGDAGSRIVARDVDGGTERLITTGRVDGRSLQVSPDGRWMAFIMRTSDGNQGLQVASTSGGGASRTVYRTREGERIGTAVAWTPDGSLLLFIRSEAEGERGLWSVAAGGDGVPVRLGDASWCCTGHDIRIHPDGDLVAFVGGRDRGAIWRLEVD